MEKQFIEQMLDAIKENELDSVSFGTIEKKKHKITGTFGDF